jgi:hypothetical protein
LIREGWFTSATSLGFFVLSHPLGDQRPTGANLRVALFISNPLSLTSLEMNSKAFKIFSGLAVMLLLSVKLLGVHALIHAAEDTTIDKCELCEVVVKDVQESLGSELTADFDFTTDTETQYIDKVIHYESVVYRYDFSLQVLSRPPPRV